MIKIFRKNFAGRNSGFTPLDPERSCSHVRNGGSTSEELNKSPRLSGGDLTGFTLIELLVVIAIIGVLSSIVLASLNTARAKARDARRINDLKQIQLALELFFDANGQYPQPSQGWGGWSGHCPNYGNNDNYISGLAPTYIPVLPRDPRYDDGSNCYLYNSNGTDYMVMTHLTMETIVGGDPSAAGNPPHIQALDRVCCWQPSIAVYTPGARNW